ncbi:hypothetical protein HanIR_Chr03g0121991 [Helianthus annuus]|nr:hypothetical protein HanIR_Chr03g0121991 [Helianthus annuus]
MHYFHLVSSPLFILFFFMIKNSNGFNFPYLPGENPLVNRQLRYISSKGLKTKPGPIHISLLDASSIYLNLILLLFEPEQKFIFSIIFRFNCKLLLFQRTFSGFSIFLTFSIFQFFCIFNN